MVENKLVKGRLRAIKMCNSTSANPLEMLLSDYGPKNVDCHLHVVFEMS